MDGSHWYAVEVLPQAEAKAQEHLARQGFASFCPKFRKLRRHARRKDLILAPLFPGYLFVRFDRQRDHWRSINGTTGVRRIVTTNPHRPVAMPPEAIGLLLERCDPVTACLRDDPLEKGVSVRFASGPFMDRLATVESLDSGGRVRLLLEILGGQQEVCVPRGELVLA